MIKKVKLLIILAGILLAGCFETEIPPVLTFDGEANMTIAEFQQFHQISPTNPTTLIEEDVIITGLVTSTDKYGSCYKEIYFQDSTGGLCIRTSNTSYFNKYSIGQRIFVKAKGLYLGNYVSGSNTGFYQICLFGGEGGTQYLSNKAENQHVFRSGMPEPCPAPKLFSKQSDINIPEDYHTLVRIENCRFEAANGTTKYFEASGTSTTISRRIRFNVGGGNGIDARISAYCTFANNILPTGTLNITGILTKFYDDTPQLIICSISDVETMPAEKTLKSYDMSTNPFDAGWTHKQITGDAKWTYTTGSQNSVRIDPAGNETESWFVSPKFNFAGEENVALSFSYRILNGGTKENFKVKYTIDGSNWNELEFAPVIGGNTDVTLKLPAHIATNPNLQFAFQYKTTNVFPIWAIYKVVLKGNVTN